MKDNRDKIRVNIDRIFPLDETAQALDCQKDIHPRGKVVLAIEKGERYDIIHNRLFSLKEMNEPVLFGGVDSFWSYYNDPTFDPSTP